MVSRETDVRLGDEVAWSLVDAAPDGIVITDRSGRILVVNRQTEALFGYDRSELLGASVDELLPQRFRAIHRAHRTRYRAEPRTRLMGAGISLLGRRKDGTEFPVEISLSPVTANDQAMVVAAVRDVSERLETEQRLGEAEQELRTLEDHERIARDLHDIVIQQLFASGMTLQGVWSRIKDPDVAQRVATVVDDLDATIREIRAVIFGLQTLGADAGGRRAEILRVASDERAVLGFEPRVRFDGPIETITDEVAAHLLATLREALSNVARHARAASVDVTIEAGSVPERGTGAQVVLCVSDDGVGIPEDADGGGGNGIRNMTDRAVRLGGRCAVRSRPEGGTVVEWSVPPEGITGSCAPDRPGQGTATDT
ncbi:MAG: PAS domain S-box protein [Acidimicrobiia bacterium]